MAIQKVKLARDGDKTAKEKEKSQADGSKDPVNASTPDLFPYARFTSVVGVHTSLLAFTAFFLPRTSLSFITDWVFNSTYDDELSANPPGRALRLLTESPLRTVGWLCAGAAVLQAWWAVWLRNWGAEEVGIKGNGSKDVEEKVRSKKDGLKADWIQPLYKASTTTLATSFAFHAILILFGAPITSYTLETYALSLLLALLTIFAPAYILGPPSLAETSEALVTRLAWVRLFAELSPRNLFERALVYPAAGAFLGCWAGAIPIALDWERPWQAWPLTPAYGALSGYIVGALSGLAVTAVTELARADISLTRLAAAKAQAAQDKAKKKRK